MTAGVLDTDVFVHAHTTDGHSEECRRFLAAVENGSVRAGLEPIVLHELSYVLPRYVKGLSRTDVAEYLLMVLGWRGVEGDLDVLEEAVGAWQASSSVGFVDAYLAARARELGYPVYTKNARDFSGTGVDIPDPLPA